MTDVHDTQSARSRSGTTRALRNLHQPLTVDQLAHRVGMSRRTLIRRFHTDTGLPPVRWLLDARLARARELLESSDLTVEAVARHCGLGTPAQPGSEARRGCGRSAACIPARPVGRFHVVRQRGGRPTAVSAWR
ncbi:helix-turn-helix domain-containing protein [Streptomyces lydicus]